MKSCLAVVGLIGALLATSLLGQQPPQQNVEESIRQLDQQTADAVNAGDLESLAKLYTSDVVFYLPGQAAVEGIQSVRAFMAQMIAAGAKVRVRTGRVESSGDLAVELADLTMIMPNGKGATSEQPGKIVNVWRRQPDGTWRLAVHAPSPNGSR
jgi:uncharacterized protein (TIGR02246 family)